VIETSGSDQHPILRRTANADNAVDGSVLELTWDELRAADAYEVDRLPPNWSNSGVRAPGLGAHRPRRSGRMAILRLNMQTSGVHPDEIHARPK